MIRKSLILASLSAATLLLSGCDWMPGKPTEADKPVIRTTITNFETLWTNQCSGCHGADGRWGPARPMNDPLYLAIVDKDYVTKVISDGVPNSLMPPYAIHNGGSMTDEQIKDVVDGMWKHWANPTATQGMSLPSIQGDLGTASRGEKLFKTYCSECHGDDGNGGKAGSVVDSTFLSLVSDQALRSAIICGRIDLGMPNYAGYAGGHKHGGRSKLAPLNDSQISDIVAWLASHRVTYPGQPYPNTTTLDVTAVVTTPATD
ncbi:MAG: cytochrome C [Phycisphaerae bacterium]|nr:cytochrome C [Phycisphaerae bacterium]